MKYVAYIGPLYLTSNQETFPIKLISYRIKNVKIWALSDAKNHLARAVSENETSN